MKYKLGVLICLVVGFLGACQTVPAETQSETVTVTDAKGQQELPFKPQKVAVFDHGVLDTMKVLGLEQQISGAVTQNPPAYLADFATEFESIGSLKEPDIETLATMAPDLIIISGRLSDFSKQLQEIAPVLELTIDSQNYWDSVQANIQTLGIVFDETEQVDELLADLEEDVQELNKKADAIKDEKAMVLMLNDGAISAFSTGSRFGFIFDTFGFEPVEAAIDSSQHGQNMGYEGILEINPDIIFVVDRSQAIQENAEDQLPLLDNEFVNKTTASQNDHVISLTSDLWYLSGGGLESFGLMIEEMNHYFE